MANDVSLKIAAEVRAEIARQNRSTREIAEAIGVRTRQSMSMRLKGDKPFTVEELMLLAKALGVPIEQFLPADTSERVA